MNDELKPVRVWDLPTRVFHWLLAFCVISSIVSGLRGGGALEWHMRLGYAAFALLLFRIVWGLVGGRWSRFGSFLYAPGTILRYLRGEHRASEHLDVGHNPLGAFSVFGLLALLVMQVATGLFVDDEIATTGPLNKYVSGATSLVLTRWHRLSGQWLIVALIVLHVGAIVFYLVRKRQNLVQPMITGDKLLSAAVPASRDSARTRLLALVLAVLCASLVAWVVSIGA